MCRCFKAFVRSIIYIRFSLRALSRLLVFELFIRAVINEWINLQRKRTIHHGFVK
jgi:hypothetical protein